MHYFEISMKNMWEIKQIFLNEVSIFAAMATKLLYLIYMVYSMEYYLVQTRLFLDKMYVLDTLKDHLMMNNLDNISRPLKSN